MLHTFVNTGVGSHSAEVGVAGSLHKVTTIININNQWTRLMKSSYNLITQTIFQPLIKVKMILTTGGLLHTESLSLPDKFSEALFPLNCTFILVNLKSIRSPHQSTLEPFSLHPLQKHNTARTSLAKVSHKAFCLQNKKAQDDSCAVARLCT